MLFDFQQLPISFLPQGSNEDHLHSVIQFSMVRTKPGKTFAWIPTQYNAIPNNTKQYNTIQCRAICTSGALMIVLGTYGLIFASKTNLEIHKMDSKSKSRVQMVSKLKFFAFPEKQEWVLQIFSFSFKILQSRCKCAGCGFRFFTRFSVRVWWRFFLWLLKTVAHLAPEWHMARSCQSDYTLIIRFKFCSIGINSKIFFFK